MPDLDLRPERRELVVHQITGVLGAAIPGAVVTPRGSLAAGTADVYSDIDLTWIVPDEAFPDALAAVEALLGSVRPVVSVRIDPSLATSDRRRLLFVWLDGTPLFWRVDLDIRATSVADIGDFDDGNPAVYSDEGWSRPASALANAIAAIKATLREQNEVAGELLRRGFERIGDALAPPGDPRQAIVRLARACAANDPTLECIASEVVGIADALLVSEC